MSDQAIEKGQLVVRVPDTWRPPPGVFTLVRYEAPMEDVVLPPGPDVVIAWTLAAPSARLKLLLATRAAESLGATGDLTLAHSAVLLGRAGGSRALFTQAE